MKHIATITAYPAKDGTFSTAYRNEDTKEIVRVYGFETLSAAKFAVQSYAWDTLGPVRYAPLKRKGQYLANVWIEV